MANDILLFADDAGANVLTQSAYASDAQRTLGNQAGIARSNFVNKALRQTTFMSVALAQLIVDRTTQDVLDDGDDAVLLTNMKNATDVAFNTNSATAKTTPVDGDLIPIVDSAASNVLKKLSWLNIKATLKTYFDTLYSPIGSGNVTGVRQTVQSALVSSTTGLPVFLTTAASLNLPILATTEPIKVSMAGGAVENDVLVTISADTTLLLPSSSTSYVYVTSAGTISSTTLAPIYQQGGVPAVTNGQFTFNYGEMIGYLGNGTTAVPTLMAFFGEAVTDGSNVTSVVNYALNGRYESTLSAYAAGTTTSYAHNVGTKYVKSTPYLRCITTNLGYAVGEDVELGSFGGSATGGGTTANVDRNTTKISFHSSTMTLVDRGSFGYNAITAGSWNKFMIVERSF